MLKVFNNLDSIADINEALKAQNIGVRVRQHTTKRLLLRATLPPRPGSSLSYPHRQDVTTGLRDNPIDRKEAYIRAVKMAVDVTTGRFDWKDWLRQKAPRRETAAEAIKRFALHYKKNAEQGERTRWRITWEKDYLAPLGKLTPDRPLNIQEMQRLVNGYACDSRARQRHARAYEALCSFVGLKAEFDAGNYGRSKAKNIVVPTDAEILAGYDKIPEPWRWVYAVMAAYGLRPSEVVEVSGFEGAWLLLSDGKTGARAVRSFPESWMDLWNPPPSYPIQRTAEPSMEKRLIAMHRVFMKSVGFPPKVLRKAYAIRAMVNKIPDTVAGQMLGHNPSTLQSHYQSYISRQEIEDSWSRWNAEYENRV